MNFNKEAYKELKEKGALHSSIKDGKPKTLISKIIGYQYPILITIIAIYNLITYSTIKKHKKAFFVTMIIGAFWGWLWEFLMFYFDKNFPAWLFHDWGTSGIEWIFTFEDWVFYPLCGWLFITILNKTKKDETRNDFNIKIHILFFYICIGMFFSFVSIAGILITAMFTIPGVLMLYKLDKFDYKHFLKCFVLFVLFAGLWDFFAVTLMKNVYAAWAEGWVYLLFDSSGNHYQSSVFMDYKKHPWAWIGYSPIEITPYFGMAGTIFIYGLYYTFVERFK